VVLLIKTSKKLLILQSTLSIFWMV